MDAHDMTDLGTVAVADAPDTVFTIHTDDLDRTVRVYALGASDQRPPGMDADEFDARQRLAAFVEALGTLPSWLPSGSWAGGEVAYEAPAARIFVGPYREDPDLVQPPVSWPLDGPLAGFDASDTGYGYGCRVVDGSDWTDLVQPMAADANQLTPWRSDGERYTLVFRQLLPDEVGDTTC